VTAIAAQAVPVGAATARVSGTAVFDHTGATCPKTPPAGYGTFTSYPLVLSGDLQVCWYTKIEWDPDAAAGTEIWGHCEHPIVPGTGAAWLRGITGYLGFIDIVSDATTRTAASSPSADDRRRPQWFSREYSGAYAASSIWAPMSSPGRSPARPCSTMYVAMRVATAFEVATIDDCGG
jgi:hypothetical protein